MTSVIKYIYKVTLILIQNTEYMDQIELSKKCIKLRFATLYGHP